MSYLRNLNQLREKMASRASGDTREEVSNSLVPVRQSQEPVAATEDILSRSAAWLAQIKEGAYQIKKESPQPDNSGTTALVQAIGQAVAGRKKEKEPTPEKEAFIQRRQTSSPSTYAPERPSEAGGKAVPLDADVKQVLEAIAYVESRGSGDYVAKGPVVQKGMYKGQRAYGRYQVMEGNIAPWTKEALGESMTKEEFLASPSAQDAVAAHQLSKSKERFGTWEDAASVWFSGQPVAKAGKRSDGYTTVPQYIEKFRRGFRGASS